MIILEKPYVSVFLQQTVVRLQIPVLATPFSKSLEYAHEMNFVENEDFFAALKSSANPLLYSNSENSAELLNRFGQELTVKKCQFLQRQIEASRHIFSTQSRCMVPYLYPEGTG